MKPYYDSLRGELHQGNCNDIMPIFPDNHFSCIITDPPYGLGFMGKSWDTFDKEYLSEKRESDKRRTPQTDGRKVAAWGNAADAGSYDYRRNAAYQVWCTDWAKEALRVVKPGAFMLIFGGTRTHHRLMCAIEDAGWEIRDCMMWLYGSGFPKSLDISKAIDKAAGVEREIVGHKGGRYNSPGTDIRGGKFVGGSPAQMMDLGNITKPATPEAEQWDGYGTALKPAWEPIIVAMKPLDGTFAENALNHGVAGLNIDKGRIAGPPPHHNEKGRPSGENSFCRSGEPVFAHSKGRFPANIILTHHPECEDACHPDCPVEILDEQSGELKSGAIKPHYKNQGIENIGTFKIRDRSGEYDIPASAGTASRFFYTAKASRSERGKDNKHPTVKPLALIKYLIEIIAPPKDALILDMFFGSGTLGVACEDLGIKYVGIDLDLQYAIPRIEKATEQLKLF